MSETKTEKYVHKDPLDKNRSPTDVIYTRIFLVLLAIWFITNIGYAFLGGNVHDEVQNDIKLQIQEVIRSLSQICQKNGAYFVIWIVSLGAIICLLLLKTLDCLAKFWTVVALIFLVLTFTTTISNAIGNIVLLERSSEISIGPLSIFQMATTVLYLIFLTGAFHAAYTVKLDAIIEVVRKSCQAIFFFRSLFLFSLCISLLNMLIITFSVVTLHELENTYVCLFFFALEMYLLILIDNFGIMVISQCISAWYWSENKEKLSDRTVLKSIGLIRRYHIGSAIFCSTIILPVISSSLVLWKNKFQTPPKSSFKAFLIKLYLIFYSSKFAMIATASHGTNVYESTKKIYSYFIRSCALTLELICVLNVIILIIFIISIVISVGTAYAIFQNVKLRDDLFTLGAILVGFTPYLFLTFILSNHVCYTMIVNTVEEIEETEQREVAEIRDKV